MKSKDEDSTATTYCVTVGDHWTAKQHHWKSEAKRSLVEPRLTK